MTKDGTNRGGARAGAGSEAVWMDEEEQYTLSVFDLPSYIAREFARRIGAKEEEAYAPS